MPAVNEFTLNTQPLNGPSLPALPETQEVSLSGAAEWEVNVMATRQSSITSITRGNDVVLVFNISTSVALATAKFTAKRYTFNTDNEAAVLKVVATAPSMDGQITAPGPGPATVKIVLAKGDTDNFIAPPNPGQASTFTYVWDLEVFDGSSNATTPIGGTLVVTERVRTATG